jgi:two-component system, chemotaxis family, protein-glutamate methylesterase/glutaminase
VSTATHSPAARRPRILVADDSALMRRILSRALEDAGLEVVGTAADGDEALAQCAALRPDAMTLDLHMPGKDGIAVLRDMQSPGAPRVPAVVVSAFSPAHGARAVDALAEGAFELVAKPGVGTPLEAFATELVAKLRAASGLGSTDRPAARAQPAAPAAPATRRTGAAVRGGRLVVIACSTGGPKALAELMPALPGRLGAGTLIVQHMPQGFTASLAARLDRASALTIREAVGGEAIAPDVALLAPGGSHLRLAGERAVALSDEPAIGNLRPRADLTIVDAARLWGPRLLLVVLTGMGKDGLEGAQAVRRHGGRVLVEAEKTCTVYGMPRAVAEADLADGILPLNELAAAIAAEAN